MTCDFVALAQPGVHGLKPYEPGKPIETLERELGIRESVKLASNENPLGPSPKALAAMQSRMQGLSLYPDGSGHALKAAIAAQAGCEPGHITLGNGSSEILELVARAYLGDETEVVFSEHAFAVYALVSQAVNAQIRVANANGPDEQRAFGHHAQNLIDACNDKTRVVFIANPNNPTGTWLEAQELHDLLKALPREAVIVVDEAYREYVEEPNYPDAAAWLAEFPNLVVTRTFSKIYGLAGLRIGYGISNEQIADVLNRVRQPFNTNELAQAAALAALSDQDHLRKSRETNTLGLAQLIEGFNKLGLSYLPSIGNFICVDLGREAMPVYQAMLRLGVIVRPISNYGFPEHLRISVGTQAQNARALAALAEVMGA